MTKRIELHLDAQEMELEEFEFKGDKALKVRGIALVEGEWNEVWFGAKELKAGVDKLCPENVCNRFQLRANHSRDVWDVVGIVNEFKFDEQIRLKDGNIKSGIRFNAEVRLKEAVERVNKGLWGPVSVGVWGDLQRVETDELDKDGKKKFRTEAKNLEFQHLAWVTDPACKYAAATEILNAIKSESEPKFDIPKIAWGESMKKKETKADGIPKLEPEAKNDTGAEKEVKTMTEEQKVVQEAPKESAEVKKEEIKVEAPKVETPAVETEVKPSEMDILKTEMAKLQKMSEEKDKMIADLLEVNKNKVTIVEKITPNVIGTPADTSRVEPIVITSISNANTTDATGTITIPSITTDSTKTIAIPTVITPVTEPVKVIVTPAQEQKKEEPKKEDTSALIEKILSLDKNTKKEDLEGCDAKSLDALLNYLMRSKERQSVPGKGIVEPSKDTKTIDTLTGDEVTKLMCKSRGNPWVLGQIMKRLFSARPSSEDEIKYV